MSLVTLLALLFFVFAIPVAFGLTLLGEYVMNRLFN